MALSRKAKQRIGRLVDFMSSLPRSANGHFDMSQWAQHLDGDGFAEHGFGKNEVLPAEAPSLCGTTACALGWACSVPSFRRAGLRLKVSPIVGTRGVPEYAGRTGSDAAMVFFDITETQAEGLFYAWTIKTPKKWARHARELVKQWSAA